MRRVLWILTIVLVVLSARADDRCAVEVRAEARYGALGYNHIVHLKNLCDWQELCSVATDVNPSPVQAAVPPHVEVEVLTFRGSPATAFVPRVTCRPE